MVLRRSRGVTLLELLLAVSLAGLVIGMALALYKDVARVAGLAGARMQGEFQAHVHFTSMARNLMYGRGILRVAPDGLDLLNMRGRKVEYRWRDSALAVNGGEKPFRLGSLALEPLGPPIPLDDDGFPDWDAAPGLDSLDEDRDGRIGFDELDRDGDGELDLEECRLISHVRLTMTVPAGNPPSTRSVLVHPRNRARDSLSAEPDSAASADPFD